MASHGVPRPATTEQKTEQSRFKEAKAIKEYLDLASLIDAKISERQYTLEVLNLTSKLLTKNPENYTTWNVRRRLLTSGLFCKQSASSSPLTASQNTSPTATTTPSFAASSSSTSNSCTASTAAETRLSLASPIPGKIGTIPDDFTLITNDLEFIFPLMLQFPKCYWIWNYRLWLLEEGNKRIAPETARGLWERELGLVGKMLTRDNRNFHGWAYRRKVISELESRKLNGKSMVEAEFVYTTKMIKASLSNFSAWHNRSKLIPRLLDERNAKSAERRQFLDDEFDLITQAIYTDAYPYAQSVWFYYQFLMTTLTDYVGHATITPNFTSEDRIEYVTRQLVNLKDMLDGAEDCKWIYNALIEYTLALCEMEERQPGVDEKSDCVAWLGELRKLDPHRSGRWDDLENTLRWDKDPES